MKEFILGGARSGKSAFAQQRAIASNLHVIYLATAQASDTEMAERIARHRAERPSDWDLVEEPLALAPPTRQQPARPPPPPLLLNDHRRSVTSATSFTSNTSLKSTNTSGCIMNA